MSNLSPRGWGRHGLALGVWMAAAIPSLAPSIVWGAEDVIYKEEPVKALSPPPASAQVASFDPQSLVPYFPDGPLAQARERLRSGDATGAAQLLGELAQQPDTAATLKSNVQARFLLAVAQLRAALSPAAGRESAALAQRAAANFDELVKSYPLLKSYHTLFGGRAYLLAGQPQQAMARAGQVPSDSVLDCEARYLRAEAQRQLGADQKPAAKSKGGRSPRELAVASYTSFLAACPGSLHRRDAELALAQQLDSLERGSEALVLWRRLYLEVPDEVYGTLAAKRLEQPTPGVKVPPFTAAELLTRAQALFDRMRNPDSEAAYRWVLEQPELDDAQRCVASYQLAQSVFKQRQRPRAASLFDEAAATCGPAAAKNDDLHMKALYQAARCHASTGEYQRAADLFAAAEVAHPGHSYADDSRLRQAEIYSDLSDRLIKDGAKKTCQADTCPDYEAQLVSLLSDLPDRYPSGDKRAEALWRLALRSLRKRDLGTARNWLDAALTKLPREVGWDQEGRTLYWLGRVAEIQGDRTGAVRFYGRTAQEYPLSFYTLMALSRLRASFASDFERLLGELQQPPVGEASGAASFDFKPRALFSHDAFQRGLELLRLGLGSEARREFQSIGIGVADAKAATAPSPQSESEELLWLASVLFDRAGAWYLSHAIPRHLLTDWQRHYPVGNWRKYWLLAYPRGFYDILAAAARENGQPEALQLAIVREESAFDPRTESFANAVGLTQMIQPTAKRFSGGLPYDRESLRDPAINVAIGARFLGFIWGIWQQNPALAVPSYNAGEGRVVQWLKANISQPLLGPPATANAPAPPRPAAAEALDPALNQLDLFVESIPFDETRGYTKRVLASFLTYQWLYSDPAVAPAGKPPASRVPPVVFQLPPPPRLRG